MNKLFIIAWLVVFVLWMLGSFIVHATVLHPDYLALGGMYRSDADGAHYFPLMLLAHLIMSGALVWIYSRGVQAKPWIAQGFRFGIAASLLLPVPRYMIYYAVQPMPGRLVWDQIIMDSVVLIVIGIALGFMYRRSTGTE